MPYKKTCFYEEEFMGCCGIVTLFEFPEVADKERLADFKKKHEVLSTGNEWGAIVVALNNFQTGQWEKPLLDTGYKKVIGDVFNPNTGNILSMYTFDCKSTLREQEDDDDSGSW